MFSFTFFSRSRSRNPLTTVDTEPRFGRKLKAIRAGFRQNLRAALPGGGGRQGGPGAKAQDARGQDLAYRAELHVGGAVLVVVPVHGVVL
jgi:hypothetical protein